VNLYASDVTERKRAEADLRRAHADLEARVQERTAELTAAYSRIQQNERQYRLLAENVTDVIWTTDLELRFQFVSPSSKILSGRTPDEIQSMNLQEMLTPESFEAAMESVGDKIALEKGGPSTSARRPWTIDLEIVCADGGTVWTETTVTILRDESGNPVGLLGVTRDVEDRRRLEAQLSQAQKMEAIGRLAGGVAHDFNNMMHVVTGYSTRVLKTIPESDPHREHIAEIQKAGKRAATLTQQLLAFGRRQTLQPRLLDLNTIVSSMVRMLQSVLGEDVKIVTNLAPDAWHVKADPVRLEQVLMNLSVNARDAMPTGGTLTIETANVSLGEYHGHDPAVPPGSYVMLAVSDTGSGMDEETRERLFEPFFTTKASGQGTGLGLATVYGTVEQSGGAIRVYTAPDLGTTFKIYLPRGACGEKEDATAATAADSPGGCETVLVVEDEDSVRQLTVLELEELGYRVLQAQNPDEARQRSREHSGPIDLLLTDVVLPGGSGPDVYERLAPERPDMRVLFMSGHAEKRIVHHGVVDPGVAFIEKPFTSEQLATKVREVIARPPAAPRSGH
jgi:PAS domain S-box-containing protein